MITQFLEDAFGWGLIFWLIGYVLGFILFFAVPVEMLGWVIMPIGSLITIGVLWKKIKGNTMKYYLGLALIWTLLAVIFDYFFLVKMLKPADGYYKLDVYLYYALTFVFPLIAGGLKTRKK